MVTTRAAAPSVEMLEMIRTRRTAPRFRTEPVPRAVVESLIEAARWAPNHHLTEPWRIVVLTGDARAALGEAMAAETLATAADNPKAEAEAAGTRTKVLRSPVIVVVAQARDETASAERDLEDYAACCCATQNLLLAAHAHGLGAKWSTGKATRSEAAKRLLGFAPEDRIVGYVYLGYPDGEVSDSRRRPAEEVARWHGWDDAGNTRGG